MTDSISSALHYSASGELHDSLGMYWAGYHDDQDMVQAVLASQVLCAAQIELDMASILHSLDHTRCSAFRREHWHPLVVRYSQRDTASVLRFGLKTCPTVGTQADTDVFEPNTVFRVGGNAEYSKVYTYPFSDVPGLRLAGVKTCICDSISSPTKIMVSGEDFTVCDGILTVRKEHDPFDTGNYRIIQDGDDRLAVLWMCDAEYDTDLVHRYIGYPLGIDIKSSELTRKMVSSLWDTVTHGATLRHVNAILGALFDVPVAADDCTVEEIVSIPDRSGSDSGYSNIVCTGAVYTVPTDHIRPGISVGSSVTAGDVLTDELDIYPTPSSRLCRSLVDTGVVGSVTLRSGCIDGVDSTVVISNTSAEVTSSDKGQWFPVNGSDSSDSEFWSSVHSRSDTGALSAFMSEISSSGTVNPVSLLAPVCLANTVLVIARKPMAIPEYSHIIFSALSSLVVSAYSDIYVVRQYDVTEDTAEVDAPSSDSSCRYKAVVASASCTSACGSCIIRPVPASTMEVR